MHTRCGQPGFRPPLFLFFSSLTRSLTLARMLWPSVIAACLAFGLTHAHDASFITTVCSDPRRVVVTGSPGSGLAHIVYLIELATGIAAESDGTAPLCGWSRRCDHVRPRHSSSEPRIEATTFPFPPIPFDTGGVL